jgi:hypothetical protein
MYRGGINKDLAVHPLLSFVPASSCALLYRDCLLQGSKMEANTLLLKMVSLQSLPVKRE